ncbi:MAG: SAM-dependent methyltransferase, partial [Candidatus Omnitrophota bacterium]|nr:SAM-dependent methyltransferase [Candidatus Omnitrophota bacterium]
MWQEEALTEERSSLEPTVTSITGGSNSVMVPFIIGVSSGDIFRPLRYMFSHWDEAVRGVARRGFNLVVEDFYRLIFSEISLGDEARVLDIGFGEGLHVENIPPDMRKRIVGFEVMAENVKRAKERYPAQEVVTGNWHNLQFSDGSFDAVCGVNALYFSETESELRSLIAEIDRVVKSGPGRIKRIYQLFDQPLTQYWFTPEEWAIIAGPDLFSAVKVINDGWRRFFVVLNKIFAELDYELRISYVTKEAQGERTFFQQQLSLRSPRNKFFYDVNGNLLIEYSSTISEPYVVEEVGVYILRAKKVVSKVSAQGQGNGYVCYSALFPGLPQLALWINNNLLPVMIKFIRHLIIVLRNRLLSYINNKYYYADLAQETFFTFKEYMEEALYNPQWGYYASGRVSIKSQKAGGDFITYPLKLSPAFGGMIAEQAFKMWQGMVKAGTIKEGETFTILEFGGGDGTLAYDILFRANQLGREDNDWLRFYDALHYIIGERSPPLAELQKSKNVTFSGKFESILVDASNLFQDNSLKPSFIKGLILSNELLDVFPHHKLIVYPDGQLKVTLSISWISLDLLKIFPEGQQDKIIRSSKKLVVNFALPLVDGVYLSKSDFLDIRAQLKALGLDQENLFIQEVRFVEIYIDPEHIPEVTSYISRNKKVIADATAKNTKPFSVYVNTAGAGYIRDVARILDKGYILTIDYGGPSGFIFDPQHTHLFIIKNGKRNSDPYYLSGLQDISVNQNFSDLAIVGQEVGIKTVFYGSQAHLENGVTVLQGREILEAIAGRFMEREPGWDFQEAIEETGREVYEFKLSGLITDPSRSPFKMLLQQIEGTDSDYSFSAKSEDLPYEDSARDDILQSSPVQYYATMKNPGAFMSASYNQMVLEMFFKKLPFVRSTRINILDAGSGLGFNLATIVKSYPNAQITALDICEGALLVSAAYPDQQAITDSAAGLRDVVSFSEQQIEVFRKSRREDGFNPKKIRFVTGNIQNLKVIPDNSFDLVISTEALEHTIYPESAIKEFYRILKPGGFLILSTPNYGWNLAGLAKRFYDNRAGRPYWEPWGAHKDGLENRMTADLLERLVKDEGFRIRDSLAANYWLAWIHTSNIVRILGDKFPMIWLGRIFPPLKRAAMNYFILASKEDELGVIPAPLLNRRLVGGLALFSSLNLWKTSLFGKKGTRWIIKNLFISVLLLPLGLGFSVGNYYSIGRKQAEPGDFAEVDSADELQAKITNFLEAKSAEFFKLFREKFPKDYQKRCAAACRVVGFMLSKEFGIPIEGGAPTRIEAEICPFRGFGGCLYHEMLIIYRDGEKWLFVYPVLGLFHQGFRFKIICGEYSKLNDLDFYYSGKSIWSKGCDARIAEIVDAITVLRIENEKGDILVVSDLDDKQGEVSFEDIYDLVQAIDSLDHKRPFLVYYKEGKFYLVILPGEVNWIDSSDYVKQESWPPYLGRTHDFSRRVEGMSSAIDSLTCVSRYRLEGGRLLIIGPGNSLDEPLVSAWRCPDLKQIITVDWYRGNIRLLLFELARASEPEHIKEKLVFCYADAQQLPLADSSIAVCYSRNAILSEIISQLHLNAIWRELARVLEPGAVFVGRSNKAEVFPSYFLQLSGTDKTVISALRNKEEEILLGDTSAVTSSATGRLTETAPVMGAFAGAELLITSAQTGLDFLPVVLLLAWFFVGLFKHQILNWGKRL